MLDEINSLNTLAVPNSYAEVSITHLIDLTCTLVAGEQQFVAEAWADVQREMSRCDRLSRRAPFAAGRSSH